MKFFLQSLLLALVVLLTQTAQAQLSGTVTVPGTYPTLAAAITALNTSGISAATTIEVSNSETAPTGGYVINTIAAASATNLLTIKAIGAVTLTAPVGASTTVDGVIKFNGADFVSLEGFTIAENAANTTATSQMEWGIAVLSATATNGSQNISIKNCTVNLNGTAANAAEVGIYAGHHSTTALTALTPTSAAGTYANLKITGCTINNAYTGITIGISGSATNLDANVTIGESGAGNTITNFGGAATQAYGVRVEFATNTKIDYNTVDNTTITTHTSTLDGIYTTNGATQNLSISNNTVKVARGSSTSAMSAIRNLGYTGALTWNNNTVTSCVAGGSSGLVYLVYNTAAATSLTANNNIISDNINLNTTGSTALFYNTGAVPAMTFSGNTMNNNSKGAATTGIFYGYYNVSAPTSGTETLTNNTVSNQGSATFATTMYGIYSSTALTQNRVATGNTVTNLIGTTTIYSIYLVSGNNSTVTYNKVSNITTNTGVIYGVYCSGNNTIHTNNKVSNLTFNGAGTLYANYSPGTVSNIISNDTLMNVTALGAGFTCYAIYTASGSTSNQVNNNYVDNLNGVGTFAGIYATGSALNNIYNNTVKNVTQNTSATTNTFDGISISGATATFNVYANTIDNLTNRSSTTGRHNGIILSASTTANIYKNKISNLTNTLGTINRVTGINVASGTTVNVYNNDISNLTAGTSNEFACLNGLAVTAGTGAYNFYNNTVRLSGTVAGGANGLAILTGATVTAANNILNVNVTTASTNQICVLRKQDVATLTATTNNNLYYVPNNPNSYYYVEASTAAFVKGYSPNATPAAGITDLNMNSGCSFYKAFMAGKESASFFENSTFTGSSPSGTSYAKNGGQAVALVTEDITGAMRPATPDMGAYQFTGTAIVADVVPPAMTYTNIPNSICTNNVPLSVAITDASGINTTAGAKPRLWFKKSSELDATAVTNTSASDGWKYVEATNSSSPYLFNIDLAMLFTPVATADVIQYFVASQDNNGNVAANQVAFTTGYCPASVALDPTAFPTQSTIVIKSFTIIAPPVTVNAAISKPSICGTGTVVLSLTGDPATGADYQWQSSPTIGGTYTDIAGATTAAYNMTVTATSDKNFQCVVKCGGTVIVTSAPVNIAYFNPLLISTTPASRCGTGTVDLVATPSTGADVSWYNAATGGSAIATGLTYTTPSLAATTTYYAEATEGGTTNTTGRVTPTQLGAAATLTNYGLQFTVTEQVQINSVDVFSGTGTAVTVALYNAAGTTQLFTTGSVATTAGVKNTIPLSWTLAPGTYRIAEIAMTGTFYRESGTGIAYPIALTVGSQIGQITGYFTSLTAAQTTTSTTTFYYFYNMNLTTGCRSARQAVVATVVSPPTITTPASTTVCSTDPAQSLTVSSTNTGYTYEWGPAAGLNTTSGATVAALPTSTTTYIITATDNTGGVFNGCSTTGNVKITVNEIPTMSDTKASKDSVCFSEVVNFSLLNTGNATGLTYQWQSSANGITYTDIAGATAATYSALIDNTANTYYQCKFFCKGNLALTSTAKRVYVNAPDVVSTMGATRCGTGPVTLSATASAGASVRWFDVPNGGIAIASGNTFTTPNISATKDYYASASLGGGTTTSGMPVGLATGTSGVGTTNFGIVFDVLAPFTLKTVKIYPISATGATGTVTVDVINGAGTIMHSKTFTVTGSPIGALVATTLDLDFNLVPGTNYKIRPGTISGITGLQFEPSASAPSGNYGYPMVVPGLLSINTSTLTAAPTNTVRNDLYYYFYNWVITNGCESPRLAVTATVTTPPAFAITGNNTICNDGVYKLEVNSALTNYDSYTWSPATNLYTDLAATTPYTGTSATTVYFKSDQAGVQVITANALNTTSQCAEIKTTTITVMPAPDAAAVRPNLCVSGSTMINLLPVGAYGVASVEWYQSTNGTSFSQIPGVTTQSYTTPILTTTTFYEIAIIDGAGNSCPGVPQVAVTVDDPQIVSTLGATACGSGAMTLEATPSTGSNVNWYAAATGGSPIATGTTFVSPVITTSKTYYAAAASAGASTSTIGVVPGSTACGTATSTTAADYPIRFNTVNPVTIQTVTVIPAAAGTFTVALRASLSSVNLQTASFTFTAAQIGVPQVIALNFAIPTAGTYQLSNTVGGGYRIGTFTSSCYPFTSVGGGLSIVGSATTSTSATALTQYNMFYNFVVQEGCEGARVPVIATITPAPAITPSANVTICSNGTGETLSILSANTSYTYTWDPAANLSAATGASVIANPPSTTQYSVTASDAITGCNNIANITVTVNQVPTASMAVSSPAEVCFSGNVTLSLSSNVTPTGVTYQWQKSLDGITYTSISAATNATYIATITSTNELYYRCQISCKGNLAITSDPVQVIRNEPAILTRTNGANCGSGAMTLGATTNGTNTINWYAAATGGSAIATGNSFTTPVLISSTTYYAAAAGGGGGSQNVGLPAMVGTTANTGVGIGIRFDASVPFVVESIDVYPSGTGAGTATFELRNSGGTVLATYVANLTGTASPFTKVTLPVNFTVPAGLDYRIVWSAKTGLVTGMGREVTTGFTFPYTIPGVISLTASTTTGYYYYIYNWKISTGCESPRLPVTATITAPTIGGTASADVTVCSGTNTGSITLAGKLGNVLRWESASDLAFTTPLAIANTTTTVTFSNLTATTYYRAVVKNGVCNDAISSVTKVTVDPCVAQMKAKVYLNHVNPVTGLMDSYYPITAGAGFPSSDPYSLPTFSSSYTHVPAGQAVATTTPTVLAATGPNGIVDWIFVELRTGTSGSTNVVHTRAALLQADGDIVDTDGVSPVTFSQATTGNFYIAIRHRNHLGFRTDAPVLVSGNTTHNFTNNSIALYGIAPLTTHINSATTNVMNAGDANKDGSLDSVDSAIWEVENGSFDDYFLNSDYNIDGSIDGVDSALWQLNNGKYEELQ